MLAAGEVGVSVAEHQAKHLAEAAIAFFDEIVQLRQAAQPVQWDQPGFQDYLRQHMRHELLDGITRRGLVPTSLPSETLRFMGGGSYAAFVDPENGGYEVPETAEWHTVYVTLEVPVRKPPIDREAAVRAGILGEEERAASPR